MYVVIHQNNDLADVSGYPYTTPKEAAKTVACRLGVAVKLVNAEVRVKHGPTFACYVAVPADGTTYFCREGHMHLVAHPSDAAEIAMRLTRRQKFYGVGEVVLLDTPNGGK